MSQVRLSELAEGDLADIWFSIATESIDTADEFVEALRELMRKLADQPSMGRLRPELGLEVRSFVHARYIVFYRRIATGIGVARVIHGARDLPDIDLPKAGE